MSLSVCGCLTHMTLIFEQARDVRGRGADVRPLLVSAGITLAPDAFRTVLAADKATEGLEFS